MPAHSGILEGALQRVRLYYSIFKVHFWLVAPNQIRLAKGVGGSHQRNAIQCPDRSFHLVRDLQLRTGCWKTLLWLERTAKLRLTVNEDFGTSCTLHKFRDPTLKYLNKC